MAEQKLSQLYVAIAGKSGAGKSTLIKNIFDVEAVLEVSKPTTTEYFTERKIKNGVEFIVTDTRERERDWGKRMSQYQRQTDLLLFCISVSPGAKFSVGNHAIMQSIHNAFGRHIWKQCVVVFTFSNTAWERFVKKCSAVTEESAYRTHLCIYARRFENELRKLNVHDVTVKTPFELGQLPKGQKLPEEQKVPEGHTMLMAIPAGDEPEDTVFPGVGDCNHGWRDVFTAYLVQCGNRNVMKNLLRYQYGREKASAVLAIGGGVRVTAGASEGGAALGLVGAGVGGTIGPIVHLLGEPIGATDVGSIFEARIGAAIGRPVGVGKEGCMTTSIEFFGALIKKQVTSKGADIDFADIGISISIPRQPFGVSVDSVDLLIRPCLSGPFILPEGYELASPVYVIEPSQQGVLQKPCTVRIQHYISLQNERDCDGMTFISAKIAPQTRWFGPYDFKEVKSSKQTFTPNSQVGEIELRHFCCLACARWFGCGSTLYSARLYRDCPSSGLEQLGAFCMCLDQPAYTKHCDTSIQEKYAGEKSIISAAWMTGEEVELSVTENAEWAVDYDREPAKIHKREIDRPGLAPDYPPKFLLISKRRESVGNFSSPRLWIKGLNNPYSFKLILSSIPPLLASSMNRLGVSLSSPCSTTSSASIKELPQNDSNFSSYMMSLPTSARPLLEQQLDWDHEGVDRDLIGIAHHMLDWEEKLCSHLGLTVVDVHDIKEKNSGKPEFQRREALRRWKSKQGLRATYGHLLELCVKAGHSECAKAVCQVLRDR